LNVSRIHVILLEIFDELGPKAVISHASNHGNGGALSCRGDGLICTLAARDDLQVFATDRFTGLRETRRPHNQIGIHGTNNKNIIHTQILLDPQDCFAGLNFHFTACLIAC
jgi:hypothetical protein